MRRRTIGDIIYETFVCAVAGVVFAAVMIGAWELGTLLGF